MNAPKLHKQLAACALALTLGGASAPLLAADAQTPPPAADNGPPYGMGPGMMEGGYGGWGMGPGMMGDYGMGPGMMGGSGVWGMRGGHGWRKWLNLTDAQQARINKIQDEARKARWALMGTMMDEQAKLRDLYLAPKQDEAAIKATYQALGKLHEQMFDISARAQEHMEAVLTKEQREKLRRYWHRGCGSRP